MPNTNTDLIRERVLKTLEECADHGLLTRKEYTALRDDVDFTLNLGGVEERPTTHHQDEWHLTGSYQDESLDEFEQGGGEFHAIN